MKNLLRCTCLFILAGLAQAQTFPGPGYGSTLFHKPASPTQIPEPGNFQDFVVEGKLRLGLQDAVMLTLSNNSDVNINRLGYEITRFSVQRAHQPFDPTFISSFKPTRSTSPTTSSLQGATTLSDLVQNTNAGFSQLFQTGTNVGISLNSSRSSTNSSFALFNPSYLSGLSFSISQPLWRKGGLFPNRAPILIAQRNVRQSRANFEAQMNDAISRSVNQYWDVVESRKNLEVLQKSLELAEATYKQNKRALELGALPPLDIYRSESQVAQRKLAVIQAEYRLKQLEDTFRQTIGADLDPRVGSLDLELNESTSSEGQLAIVDLQEALAKALKQRPEIEALQNQLANDDANVQLANNNLKPDLNLSASYTSNGRGGVQIDNSTGLPVIVSNGGFSDSLSQLGSFQFPTYGLSLELRFPLRNSAAAADLGSALVTKRKNLYQMRQQEQSIRTEVKNAVHQLEESELTITAAKTARDLAGKNLAAEERKYELGAQTIFFVLDAQTQLSQAELNVVQSQIAYQRALTAVDHATGALLQKHQLIIASTAP
jgi:outer membrane protein